MMLTVRLAEVRVPILAFLTKNRKVTYLSTASFTNRMFIKYQSRQPLRTLQAHTKMLLSGGSLVGHGSVVGAGANTNT